MSSMLTKPSDMTDRRRDEPTAAAAAAGAVAFAVAVAFAFGSDLIAYSWSRRERTQSV